MSPESKEKCLSVTLDDIAKWLAEGGEPPRDILDLKWTIFNEKRDEQGLVSFRASYPRFPVNMLVLRLPSPGKLGNEKLGLKASGPFVRFVLETDIETIDLDPKEKLGLYRKLLNASKLPLVKYYLYGEDFNVGIAVDLDLKSLSRGELADAIAMLLLGYFILKSLGGVERILETEEAQVLASLVIAHLSRGESRDQVIEYLTSGGLGKEEAEEIVSIVERLAYPKKGREASGGQDLLHI